MWSHLKGSERFKEEIDWWLKENWISAEQANSLISRYELDQAPPWYRQSGIWIKAISILIVVMGVFLFISANWQALPIPVQMLAGLIPLGISYILAIRYYRQGKQNSAHLTMIFASLMLGANITLQAQIFHISAYFPDGVLWWIIGTIPVIFFFRSTFLAIVFQGLFLIWLFFQNEYFQFSLWSPILLIAFAYFVYRNPHWLDLLFMMGSLYMFLVNLIIAIEEKRMERIYDFELMPLFFGAYVLLFLTIFNFVKHDYSGRFAERLQTFLLTILVFFFYIFTFEGATEYIVQEIVKKGVPASFYALLIIAISLYWQQPKQAKMNVAFGIIGLIFIPALILSFIKVSRIESYTSGIFIVMNILFFAYCIWKIYYGISQREKGDFMRGIFYLFVWLIGRYIVLFEDYLTTSIIFILAGVGLYYLNDYWNKTIERQQASN
jgi:uncharacterized membrane protein